MCLGRHARLLDELPAGLAEHPLDERLAGRFMLALYRDGRPARALAHYEAVRRRLTDELGTDPGPALQRLHQRILTADAGLDPAPDARRAAPAPRPPAGTGTPLPR